MRGWYGAWGRGGGGRCKSQTLGSGLLDWTVDCKVHFFTKIQLPKPTLGLDYGLQGTLFHKNIATKANYVRTLCTHFGADMLQKCEDITGLCRRKLTSLLVGLSLRLCLYVCMAVHNGLTIEIYRYISIVYFLACAAHNAIAMEIRDCLGNGRLENESRNTKDG